MSWTLFSCNADKFLNISPQGTLDEAILSNEGGLDALLIGVYSMLDGVSEERSPIMIGGFILVMPVLEINFMEVPIPPKNEYLPIPAQTISESIVNGSTTLQQNPGY